MSKVRPDQAVRCPQCGANNDLRNPGIITLVCGSCTTTIYREGAAVRAGKKASLIPSASGIQVSVSGRISGDKVQVVGRIRFEHAQGGWDEWYCEDNKGRPIWLVEDEGRFFLERAIDKALPEGIAAAGLGDEFSVLGQRFQVVEAGEGVIRGGEGQLPRNFEPEGVFRYIDLGAVSGDERLTIEVADGEIEAFIGRPIPSDEVDFPKNFSAPSAQEQGQAQACAGCGAPLKVAALPEPVQTIGCDRCGALYGYEKQKLAQLHDGQEPRNDMHLNVGDVGILDGVEWEVVGRMVYEEYELDDGAWSSWPTLCHEYLVRSDANKIATLEITNEGIVLVEKLLGVPPVTDMLLLPWGHSILYQDKKFRMYERGRSVLVYVDGALPWRAEKGDDTGFVDCIDRPGPMSEYAATRLSIEWPGGEGTPEEDGEVEGSVGAYVSGVAFEKAFPEATNLDLDCEILRPNKVPLETFRFGCLTSMMALGALFVAFILSSMTGSNLAIVKVNAKKFPAEEVSEPFEITDDIRMIGIDIKTNLDNNWAYIEYDLLDATSQRSVAYLPAEISYYHGVEGGESWSEGRRSVSRTFVAPPAGSYQLSVSVQEGERPVEVIARVNEKSFDGRWPYRAAFVLLAFGILQVFRRLTGAPNLWPSED